MPAQRRPLSPYELPPELRNPVAVLQAKNPDAPGGATQVYVLGISHVAKSDCKRARDLIKLVKPDIVMVELCKERTGLLVDQTFASGGLWHTPKVTIKGLPTGDGWPAEDLLLRCLRSSPGQPISISQIEDDCDRLCASGLFRTVRPITSPPGPRSAPNFRSEVLPSGKRCMKALQPLGALTFEVKERVLPPIKQCSVQLPAEGGFSLDDAKAVAEALVAQSSTGASTVAAALAARAKLIQVAEAAGMAGKVDVLLDGLDSGNAVLRVETLKDGAKASITGLEGSAAGGSGWGIEPLSRTSKPGRSTSTETAPPGAAARTSWRPWSDSTLTSQATGSLPADGIKDAFATAVTRVYAALQADAGRTVGIPPGAVWQAAMDQAALEGVQQFLLGDRPTDVTRRRLAAGMFDGMAAKSALGAGLLVGAAVAASSGALPSGTEAGAVLAAATVSGVALWPLLGPLVEIAQFSKLSASEIEDKVRVKKPIQEEKAMLKLWGEDAIIDFPGAKLSIIEERDVFMARAIHAAASSQDGVCPAYVLTDASDGGSGIYRYMMPKGGLPLACPEGAGDGLYQPLNPVQAVVAVVGTAHMHGIVTSWDRKEVTTQPQAEIIEKLLRD